MICSFVDGRPYPVCINNTGSAAFKHFDPLVHTSLWQTVLSILGGQLKMDLCLFHSFRHQERTIVGCLSLVQTSSGAVIFATCSLGTNGLQLNHTCSMSPPDLELEHGQSSAVLPIIQRTFSNIAHNFLSSFH
jgi:hypothetical protein